MKTRTKEPKRKQRTEGGKKRIFIVADHPSVRQWLVNFLRKQPDVEVSGAVGDATEALGLVAITKPHVTIVDLSTKAGSEIELINKMRDICPQMLIVALSLHEERTTLVRSLRAGGSHPFPRRKAATDVLQALRCLLEGKLSVIQKGVGRPAEKTMEPASPEEFAPGFPADLINDQEFEVFKLLGNGCSAKEIADELGLGVKVVQRRCLTIRKKLQFSSNKKLLREAALWHARQA
jgi:DNA-binding NarL/FixJ family response regulator